MTTTHLLAKAIARLLTLAACIFLSLLALALGLSFLAGLACLLAHLETLL